MTSSKRKRVVLTGVSRGLGRAMAEGFIRRGHTVAGCARSKDAIDAIRRQFDPPHSFDVVDVCRDDEVRAWAERVLAAEDRVDLLVNNAGVTNANAPLWEVPADEFARVMDVNVKGVFYVLRHFLPAMVARKHGVIVNFSSGWGRSTSADFAPYCASKWAIEGLTQALAAELPRPMAAVPLNPGIVHTDMLDICFGEAASSYPDPAEWAERAVPMLLGLSRKDNGRPLSVEG